MKTLAFVLIAVMAGVVLTGCVMPLAAVNGNLLTLDVKGPVAVGDSTAGYELKGVAEATGIICFSMGDASISAAMAEGGITKIHHVDSKVFQVLGLYAKYETIVYGE